MCIRDRPNSEYICASVTKSDFLLGALFKIFCCGKVFLISFVASIFTGALLLVCVFVITFFDIIGSLDAASDELSLFFCDLRKKTQSLRLH